MHIKCPNCECLIPLLPLIYTNSAEHCKEREEKDKAEEKESKKVTKDGD